MAKNYKCPYCEKRLIRKDLITHIDKSHKDLIPENYTAARLVYNIANKTEYGRCRVCGKETQWSEKNGRYNVLCGSIKCKEHMREEYKKNMLRVKGTYNILNDPEQQKIMLANRSISGKYKFQDGGEHIFTGSYEKKCLEFMDIVMQISSDDIMSPGPTLEYEYNGQKHFYIADFYYIPYNLIIEVKDGGDNINTKDSASMRASREKTIEKERIITDRGEYNYIRLTNNNFTQLIEVFMDIKEKLLRGDDSKTYKINESQIILEDYFVDKKDIYYNKDKFDSGEINLCFITGLSGSGKTTMGKTMQSGDIEVYGLDDIISNWNFSDANLKEYGGLVYSFFKGPGKTYRYTSYDEWMNDSKWDNPTNPYVNSYDAMIIKDFVKYAKSYANSHKNIKFVLEGVWVFYFIDPKELDSYAVYIKGASALISFIRAAKRDCQDANSNMEKFGAFIKIVTSIGRMKAYLSNEKRLLRFYEYFASKAINESQTILEGLFGYSYYIKAGTEKTTKCFYDSTIITKKAAVYCAISSNIQSKLQANGYMPGYENKYKITIVKAGNYAFENKKFTLYKVNKKDEIGTSVETMTLKEFADKYKIKYEIDSRDANDLVKIKKEIKRVQGFIKTEFNKYSIFKKYEMETEMYNEEESIEAYANRQQRDVNIVMIHCPYSRLNDESEMKKVEAAGESLIKNVNNKILPDSKIIVEWDHLNMLISLKMLKGYTESQVVLENTNISDIRNVINKIYQKYLKDKKPPTGNQNCQLCTWCVESWFRGINVLPRPIYSPTDIAFKFNGYDIVKNPELIKFISKEDFKRIIHSSGNGSRYYVHVKWNGGSGGHEFMAIDIDNIIYIIDAQQGIIENMDTSYVVKDYFNINYDESYMVRLDNKQFNKELLKYNNNKYIKQLTEDDMKMLEENAIDESLEDISGVVFGKRKLIQDKYITLYHGTSIKDLPWISPLSGNVGLKNAKPKMSSFWFNNLDYAITFSTMDYIARNLNDKDVCRSMVLDNDMKVLIDNKYKSKIIASIKNGESYVYERTIESKYVGYGHNGVFPEYTLDIPVKPDRYYVIKFKDMISKIKFVSESYIKSIKQKYADGKMDFGNNKMQLLMDRVFYYSGHNDRVDKIKQAKAYSKISFNDILHLNKMLNQYEYIIPNNGNIITQVSEDSFNKYKLLSPDEFKKYKGGICWDYVVYEAYWFDKYFTNIPYSVYFEVLDNKIDCPTHTFLIFEYGGKYYWFESSWKPMCGVYGGFDTEKDAVDYVMSELNDSKSNYKNYICKYDPLDSKMFGMNSKQFMDYLLPKVKPYKFPNKVVMPTTVIKGTTPEHKSY